MQGAYISAIAIVDNNTIINSFLHFQPHIYRLQHQHSFSND